MITTPSFGISRIVGYSLLLMVMINWGDIFLPLQLMNPTWELQTVGAVVESMPLLFFSLVFIFHGEGAERNRVEQMALKLLSHACLVMVIGCIALVLVATTSFTRINQQIESQSRDIFVQRTEQLSELEDQLGNASNEEIINILQAEGVAIATERPEPAKQQLLDYLSEAKQTIRTQTEVAKQQQRRTNLKSTLKWIVGAIISGFTFGYLWKLTRWARVSTR